MEERTLLSISIIVCFLGLSIIALIYFNYDLKESGAIETTSGEVKISGEIIRIEKRGSLSILQVQRTIPVISFQPEKTGKVDIYGEVQDGEFIASKVVYKE